MHAAGNGLTLDESVMANKKDLPIIRAARAGQAAAQLRLGKLYLSGESLPRSLPTALYWLDRAARQDEAEAWLLIGREIPYEIAVRAAQPEELCIWYERAFDAGLVHAGFVMARLVLANAIGKPDESVRCKALKALQTAAMTGIAEAQWLWTHYLQPSTATATPSTGVAAVPQGGHLKEPHAPSRRRDDLLPGWPASVKLDGEVMLAWAERAARGDIWQARHALAERAWSLGDNAAFLRWALPLARDLVSRFANLQNPAGSPCHRRFRAPDICLLSRCAQALFNTGDFATNEVVRFWECAAQAGDRFAQYSLGLWFARMDGKGRRVTTIPGVASYKKSARWLSLAAAQGLGDAWYALSKIHPKLDCSQHNIAEMQRCLERAGWEGHGAAQLELGIAAWRGRRDDPARDIQAAYWLRQAAAQGIAAAQRMLDKVAVRAAPAAWAQAALDKMPREAADRHPLLVARVELAATFGLTRIEALLIDPKMADCGHSLLVDIRARHRHGKRRLIRVESADERRMLDRFLAAFEKAVEAWEGNYRQRLYRLKVLTLESAQYSGM